MRVIVYSHSEYVPMAAMAEGIVACGHRVIWRLHTMYRADCYEPCDVCVIFGQKDPMPLILQQQREHGTPVLVLDLGYLKRGTIREAREHPDDVFWSVGLNGLTGFAEMPDIPYLSDRWDRLGIALQPWRTQGEHILVCGQLPGDAMVRGLSHPEQWAMETIDALRQVTDRPIRYRRHPLFKAKPLRGVEQSRNADLSDDLTNCHCVVAYNSTSLARAVISGVPVCALGPGSLVTEVAIQSLEQIEEPITPDRSAWAAQLAWRQFTLNEMKAGLAWRFYFERPSLAEWQPPVEDPGVRERAQSAEDGTHHGARRSRAAKPRAPGRDAGEPALPAA